MTRRTRPASFSEAFERADDTPANPSLIAAGGAPTIGDVIMARYSRRVVMKGLLGATAIASLGGFARRQAPGGAGSAFAFEEIPHGIDETHHVAPDHDASMLIRWGDPLFDGLGAFDPYAQSARDQARRFGYNNDYIGFVPREDGPDGARALLCVNHEYTSTNLMFPGLPADFGEAFAAMTEDQVDIEMAAHGGSVIEIVKSGGRWSYVVGAPLNRRITAGSTVMDISGPAAGHDRMKTSDDARGRRVTGTINNCAGGVTPWRSYLMAEENFHGYFTGALPAEHREAGNYERYGLTGAWYAWGRFHKRFDLSREPNEANRFGWVVEVDPFDPEAPPKKRTALGRFKHEGAESVVNKDGRVVVYMGDDQRFEYIYKFVTAGRYSENNPAANKDLLDDGTLYVARFNADGTLDWAPLIYGQGPLTEANGFASQADVLIETRRAADLLGATPMDRPEDIEPNGHTGKVYAMLTNNSRRTADQTDAANPRAENNFGHIIEITEPDSDFASTQSRWDIVVKCGDPGNADIGAKWHSEISANGWFASPDNCAIDPAGRLWVATDGAERAGTADGVWALDVAGEARGLGRMFFRAPIGAEVCGPKFSADGETLFLGVQHPGDGDGATFEAPATRWPDFDDAAPPRPSVLAISKKGGGPVGS